MLFSTMHHNPLKCSEMGVALYMFSDVRTDMAVCVHIYPSPSPTVYGAYISRDPANAQIA